VILTLSVTAPMP